MQLLAVAKQQQQEELALEQLGKLRTLDRERAERERELATLQAELAVTPDEDKAKELLVKHLRETCDQRPMVKAAASGIPVGETTQAVLAGDDEDPLTSLRLQ